MGKKINKILLLSLIVALTGEAYWNFFLEGFRVSAAVVLLPVLLLTLTADVDAAKTGVLLSAFILAFRTAAQLLNGALFADALLITLPGAMYYLAYCGLFRFAVPQRDENASLWLVPALALCDFGANCVEAFLKASLLGAVIDARFIGGIDAVAVTRAVLAFLVLAAEGRYRRLLTGAQHEARYQRLFMMKTGLKSEVYFMQKNSEEIESVMAGAYRLYEQLTDADASEETKKTALSIARDVHEIKKDYVRIIQGLEQEIGDAPDEEGMSLSDIFHILKDTAGRQLRKKKLDIKLSFSIEEDFVTRQHYTLMNVLKNLVTNAAEAIEAKNVHGEIFVTQQTTEKGCLFTVQDDGCGIPQKDIDNIFRMGFSTKFNDKTGSIYRGVGLAGVKMTVEEQLGGKITVCSAAGKGACFEVLIPCENLKEPV